MSASHLKIDFADVRSIVLYAHSPMEVVHESSFRHCISTCALPAVGVGGMPEKSGPGSGRTRFEFSTEFSNAGLRCPRKFQQVRGERSSPAAKADCRSRGNSDLRGPG